MPLMDSIRNQRVYFIAEMSSNHGGRLETALETVRAAKGAGADCLKLQTYTADTMTISCDNEYFRIRGGLWDGKTLYELYREACTPWEWHRPIKEECGRAGLDFLSTPFDRSSVDFLEELETPAYKISSFELVDLHLIEYAAGKGKPMILSCGMANLPEIADAVQAARTGGCGDIILLKCCSEYPAAESDMNLASIPDMKRRFCLPVGLSDHSPGSFAAVAAVSLGACVVEKHFCLSRGTESPDSRFSMEPEEFERMVRDAKAAARAVGEPQYGPTEGEKPSLAFRRSLFAVEDIRPGELFTDQNVRTIRPGQGLPPKYLRTVLGKRARRAVGKGTPISYDVLS